MPSRAVLKEDVLSTAVAAKEEGTGRGGRGVGEGAGAPDSAPCSCSRIFPTVGALTLALATLVTLSHTPAD